MNRVALGLLSLVAVGAIAACSGAKADQAGPGFSAPAGAVAIEAKDISFATKTVSAPANKPFVIDFDNEDGAPHNVVIVDGSGRTQFEGEVFGGSAHMLYDVPALAAGTYTFKCAVHPDMTGTLTVQ